MEAVMILMRLVGSERHSGRREDFADEFSQKQ
jgi:hypothetical protein